MRFILEMKGFGLFGKLLESFGLLEGGNTLRSFGIFLRNKGKIFLFLKSSGWLSLEGFCKGKLLVMESILANLILRNFHAFFGGYL